MYGIICVKAIGSLVRMRHNTKRAIFGSGVSGTSSKSSALDTDEERSNSASAGSLLLSGWESERESGGEPECRTDLSSVSGRGAYTCVDARRNGRTSHWNIVMGREQLQLQLLLVVIRVVVGGQEVVVVWLAVAFKGAGAYTAGHMAAHHKGRTPIALHYVALMPRYAGRHGGVAAHQLGFNSGLICRLGFTWD